MLRGYIDEVSALEMAGWITDDEKQDEPVEIVVFINGAEVIRCVADLYREDLLSVIDSPYHGFQFGLYDYLREGQNEIDVKVDGAEWTFEGLPVQIIKAGGEQYVDLGKDGWLFLKNDSNNVNDMVRGKKAASEENVRAIRRSYIFRKLFSERCGARFLQVIAPEKNVACNNLKMLPLLVSDDRPAVQICRDMAAHGETDILYPVEICSTPGNREKFFYKTDTHLSHRGQIALFSIILDWLHLEHRVKTTTSYIEFSGDLGTKFSPPRKEMIEHIEPSYNSVAHHDFISEKILSGGRLTGGWAYNNSGEKKGGRVILYGTSTAFYMRQLFYSQFSEVLFHWGVNLDFDLIKGFHPDFVIGILTERLLGTPPRDLSERIDIDSILQTVGSTSEPV